MKTLEIQPVRVVGVVADPPGLGVLTVRWSLGGLGPGWRRLLAEAGREDRAGRDSQDRPGSPPDGGPVARGRAGTADDGRARREWIVAECGGGAAGRRWFVSAALVGGLAEGQRVLELLHGSDRLGGRGPEWVADDGGLRHVEVAGLLSVSFRIREDGSAQVLYARTGLLSRLGLGGGRYEVDGGHWRAGSGGIELA